MPLPVRTSAEIRAQNEYCDTRDTFQQDGKAPR